MGWFQQSPNGRFIMGSMFGNINPLTLGYIPSTNDTICRFLGSLLGVNR